MFVREIMSPCVEAVSPDMLIEDAAKKMRDAHIGCLLVEGKKSDEMMGIVTDRDITCRATAQGKDPKKTTVGDVMSKDPVYCFDDQDVADVAQVMEAKKVHRLPVMDHFEHVIGMVSVSDMAIKGARDLSAEVLNAITDYALVGPVSKH